MCYLGSKCVCGSKSDSSNSDAGPKPRAKTRPAISTAHSESTLTVFANGHHKPCHRTNNLAHTSGAPYRIPRAHAPSHASTGPFFSSDSPVRSDGGERSTTQPGDDLSRTNTGGFTTPATSFGLTHGVPPSMDRPGLTTTVTVGPDLFGFDGTFVESSLSSMPTACLGTSSLGTEDASKTDIWADNPFSPASMHGLGDFSFSPTTADGEWTAVSQSSIDEQALFGATDLPLIDAAVTDGFPRPVSLSGESARCSAPGLAASSSGAQSEVGDSTFLSDPEHLTSIPQPDLFFPSKGAAATDGVPYTLETSIMQDPFRPLASAPLPDNRLSLDLNMLRQGPSMLAPDLSRSTAAQSHEVPINFWSAYAKSRRSPYENGLPIGTRTFLPTIPFEDDSRSLAIPASIEEVPDDMAWYSGLRTELEQWGNPPSNTAWLDQL